VPGPADPERLKRLEQAIAKLPRGTREIFLAHRIDALSYEQIAKRTGLPVRDVERHMAKAILRLAKALDRSPGSSSGVPPAGDRPSDACSGAPSERGEGTGDGWSERCGKSAPAPFGDRR
jgi:hypothetical protein